MIQKPEHKTEIKEVRHLREGDWVCFHQGEPYRKIENLSFNRFQGTYSVRLEGLRAPLLMGPQRKVPVATSLSDEEPEKRIVRAALSMIDENATVRSLARGLREIRKAAKGMNP